MTTTHATSAPTTRPEEVTVLRRNLLRACYLLLAVGLGVTAWPALLAADPGRPLTAGVVDAVLCGIQLLAVVGLVAPVRMLPLLVFEVVWKALWTATVALPLWSAGDVTPAVAETAFACAWAIPFVVVIPWRVALRSLPEPWRAPHADRLSGR